MNGDVIVPGVRDLPPITRRFICCDGLLAFVGAAGEPLLLYGGVLSLFSSTLSDLPHDGSLRRGILIPACFTRDERSVTSSARLMRSEHRPRRE
jgi:hypothetical protein